MTVQPANYSAFIDAARDSLAREIATVRHEAQREREIRDAEHRARLAELDARIASVANLERQVAERLASLKDGEPGRDGVDGKDGRDGVDGAPGKDGERGVDGQPGANGRDGLDGSAGTDGKDGSDGRSVDVADLVPLIRAETEAVLATWERPKDGVSVTVEDVMPALMLAVSEAVAALPPAKDGRDGLDGKDGRDGEPGAPGEKGDQGERGEAGHVGENGRDGIDGRDGERGLEGPAGKLPIVSEWADRVYYEGEVVTRNGSVFQAARDTGKEPGHEDWTCIVERGRDGLDGRSFNVRGTYDVGDRYGMLDVVVLNGGSFAARTDDPGSCPGAGWQLIASQGKQGKPGERGATGVGLRGVPGSPVTSMSIDDQGILSLQNGDGSVVTCDLYPLLSKLG